MSNYEENYEDEDYYEDDEIESDDSEETSPFPNYSDGDSEEEDEEVIQLDEVEFENLTEEQQAWILSTEAVAEFGIKFAEYIKAVDNEMWKRARDYALDYVQIEGVEFNFGDDDEQKNKPT